MALPLAPISRTALAAEWCCKGASLSPVAFTTHLTMAGYCARNWRPCRSGEPRHACQYRRTGIPTAARLRWMGSIRAARVPSDTSFARSDNRSNAAYDPPHPPMPAFATRRVEPHPERVRSPTSSDAVIGKRQRAAALHDAARSFMRCGRAGHLTGRRGVMINFEVHPNFQFLFFRLA